jgi:hypothetical protein
MQNSDDYDEITIHWVSDVPVANLRPVVNATLPLGDWISYNRFRQISDHAVERLCMLKGKSMPGMLFPVISRSLDKIALVEKSPTQKGLDLSPPPTDAADKSTDPEMSNGTLNPTVPTSIEDIKNESISIGIDLLKRYDDGEQISAEMFLQALGQSPDWQLTTGTLKAAGGGQTAHGGKVSFEMGSFPEFPGEIESGRRYHMRLYDFEEIGQDMVKAEFQQIHIPGEMVDDSLARSLKSRYRMPVTILGSADQLLFRICAAAGLEIEAEVTMTMSTYERTVKGFTLVSLINRSDMRQQLDQLLTQMQLPL